MKLHIPTGLRSALLACFAAVAGFATTLSTGVLTGGVFVATLATQQAVADTTNVTTWPSAWTTAPTTIEAITEDLTDTIGLADDENDTYLVSDTTDTAAYLSGLTGSSSSSVYGGTRVTAGTSSFTGNSWLYVTGSSLNYVVGGGYAGSASATDGVNTFEGNSYVYVTGGSTVTKLIGGSYAWQSPGSNQNSGGTVRTYTTFTGDTNVYVDGEGTVVTTLVGGSVSSGLTNGFAGAYLYGSVNVTVAGGTVTTLVGGGYDEKFNSQFYIATDSSGNATSDYAINISLTGGTVTTVCGGVYSEGTSGGKCSSSVGNICITVDGSSVGTIYGGSYWTKTGSSAGSVDQGAITIALTSGSLSGNLYAAGYQSSICELETASTEIVLDCADFNFSGDSQVVSGGYGGSGTGSATVTNDTKLTLEGSGTYSASNVTFEDFDTIDTASGLTATLNYEATSDTYSSLTKTGEGSLVLSSSSDLSEVTSLTVSAGSLTVSADTATLTSVSVASGASLHLDTADTTYALDLTGLSVDGSLYLSSDSTYSLTSTVLTSSVSLGTVYIDETVTTDASAIATALGLDGSYEYSNGALTLSASSSAELYYGEGGEATLTWTTGTSNLFSDGTDGDYNLDSSFTNANSVTFSGTVTATLGESGLTVNSLTVKDGASLTLNGGDSGYTLTAIAVDLQGTLTLATADVLAISSGLTINGGALVYNASISDDFSEGLTVAEGSTVDVTVADGVSIAWADDDGVANALRVAVAKSGGGTLSMSSTAALTGSEAITVNAGTLSISSGGVLTMSGAISVAEGASLTLSTGASTALATQTITSAITGGGTVTLIGMGTSTTADYVISSDLSNFTGTLVLQGGSTWGGGYNRYCFYDETVLGSDTFTLELKNGANLWIQNLSGDSRTIACDVVLSEGTNTQYKYLNGSGSYHYYFTGDVSGSGYFQFVTSFAATFSGAVSGSWTLLYSNQRTGTVTFDGADLTKWTGAIDGFSSYKCSFYFVDTILADDGSIFGDDFTLKTTHYYYFDYDNGVDENDETVAKTALLNATLAGNSTVYKQGTATVALVTSPSGSPTLNVEEGTFQIGTADVTSVTWSGAAAVSSGATLDVYGTLSGAATNAGAMNVASGATASGAITNTGALNLVGGATVGTASLESGSAMTVTAASGSTATITTLTIADATATITLDVSALVSAADSSTAALTLADDGAITLTDSAASINVSTGLTEDLTGDLTITLMTGVTSLTLGVTDEEAGTTATDITLADLDSSTLASTLASYFTVDGNSASESDGTYSSAHYSNATLSYDSDSGSILLTMSAVSTDWTWTGKTADGTTTTWTNDSADGWDDGTSESSPNGKRVYFVSEGEGAVTIDGTVTPAAIVVSSGEHTFSGTGVIDTDSLTVSGGTLSIENTGGNDIGTVTISAGTVTMTGNDTMGTVTISGGTVTMPGNNTIVSVTISGGTVDMDGYNTIGSVTVSGGMVDMDGYNTIGSVTVSDGTVDMAGDNTINSVAVSGGELTLDGSNSIVTVEVSGGKLVLIGDCTLSPESTTEEDGGVIVEVAVGTDVTLSGGTLEIASNTALCGADTISVTGESTILYDTAGVTEDISGYIDSVEASLTVEVTAQPGATVTWADSTGINAVLAGGLTKTGEGALALSSSDANLSGSGTITVRAGSLTIDSGSGYTLTLGGDIAVADGASIALTGYGSGTTSLTVGTADGDTTLSVGSGATATLTANSAMAVYSDITGSGNVVFGVLNTSHGGAVWTLSGDNSAFAGTLTLYGDGSGSGKSIFSFSSGAAAGGSGTTLVLSGSSVYIASDATDTTIASDVVISAISTGTNYKNFLTAGGVSSYTFSGDISGDGTLQLLGGVSASFTGDLTGFSGTLEGASSGTAAMSFNPSTSGGNIFGDGATLGTQGATTTFAFSSSNDLNMNATVTGGNLTQAGSGTLTLTQANTSSGTLSVSGGTVNIATDAAWAGDATVESGATLDVYGTVTGATTNAGTLTAMAGSTLGAVTNSGSVTAYGDATLEAITSSGSVTAYNGAALGAITLNSGSTLTVTVTADSSTTTVNATSLALNDGSTLALDASDGYVTTDGTALAGVAAITLDSATTDNLSAGTATITITGLDAAYSEDTYIVIATGATASSLDTTSITVSLASSTASTILYDEDGSGLVYANGTLYYLLAGTSIWTWENGTSGTATVWTQSGSSTDYDNWGQSSGSSDGANVYFTSEYDTTYTVEISGTVTPETVTVEKGSYVFTDADEAGSIDCAAGSLSVGADAELTLENTGGNSFGAIENAGALDVADGTLEADTMTNSGTLTISGGSLSIASSLTNSGAITVTAGSLDLDGTATNEGTLSIDADAGTADATNTISVSELAATAINGGISLAEYSALSVDSTGDVSLDTATCGNVAIAVSSANASTDGSAEAAISATGGDVSLTATTDTLSLTASADTLTSLLNGGDTLYVKVVDGTLTVTDADGNTTDLNSIIGSMVTYGYGVDSIEDGTVVITNSGIEVFSVTSTDSVNLSTNVSGDDTDEENYNGLDAYDAVSIAAGQTLTLNFDSDGTVSSVTVNNLVGGTGSLLDVTNESSSEVTVVLATTGDSVADNGVGLAGDSSVTFAKTGEYELVIGGEVDIYGTLAVSEGSMTLTADDAYITNVVVEDGSELTLAGDAAEIGTATVTDASELTLSGTGATVDTLTATGGSTVTASGDGATITTASLAGSTLDLSGTGTTVDTLTATGGSTVTASGDGATITTASLAGSTLDLSGAADTVGTLTATDGSAVTVSGGDATIATANLAGSTLTVSGDDATVGALTATDGSVVTIDGVGAALTSAALTDSSLSVSSDTSVDTLSLDGSEVSVTDDSELTVATLEDSGDASTVTLSDGSTLTLTDSGALSATTISGGSLALESASLSLSGSASLDGVALSVDADSVLDLGDTSNTVTSLDSEGTIAGSGASLTVGGDCTVSGDFSGSGALTVTGSSSFSSDVTYDDWSIANKGTASFDLVGADGETSTLTLSSLTLSSGSSTSLTYNSDSDASALELGTLVIEDGAALTITSTGETVITDSSFSLGTVSDTAASSVGDADVTLSGLAFKYYEAESISIDDSGEIVVSLVRSSDNTYAAVTNNQNSLTGATLLWDAIATVNMGESSDLYQADAAVQAAIASGDSGEANRLMAAVAGSGVSVLGSALLGDVDRQLRAIRNRTTSMGVNPCVVNEDMPYFNAWINAEGDYRKVDADGWLPGYELTSWGGTVGFDVDFDEHVTAGLAVTAMYGDLDADSADAATGDFNTYYLSLFARVSHHRWTHTFVGTFGLLDGDLKRTVNYGSGSYSTKGDTDGTAFGLMYELGYTIPLNADATSCLQPIVNVAWRHVNVGSYTERGADSALRVGGQTLNVVTFGAGLRAQSLVGENAYNRSSLLEARALLKVDAGDREGEAAVALINGGGSASGKVKSSETGAVGAEVGVGLTIPIDEDSGAIFIDASLDLRDHYTNINGVVGYRVNF